MWALTREGRVHKLVASHWVLRTWGGLNPTTSVLHLLYPRVRSRLLPGQCLCLDLAGPGQGWRRGCGRDSWTLPPSRPGPGPVTQEG